MKNIFKLLFVLIATSALLSSCNKETFSESSNDAVDLNSTTYYLQFVDAAQSGETGVSLDGGLIEVETTVAVALMGVPQKTDITVDLTLDASSTIDASMYSLGASSITIPAGQTSGSVAFSTVAANMPVGETVKFVMNMDGGTHNNPNPNGTQVNYTLKRIAFCPLDNGATDLVGAWSGSDAWYGSGFTVALNADGINLDVTGLGWDFLDSWWGEPVVAGGTCKMNFFGNGVVEIPRQDYCTTIYDGANYDYEIEGSGKWTNCGDSPTLLITYDIYYPGDIDGLAATYSPAYLPTPYMTADAVLSGKKSVTQVIELPKVER